MKAESSKNVKTNKDETDEVKKNVFSFIFFIFSCMTIFGVLYKYVIIHLFIMREHKCRYTYLHIHIPDHHLFLYFHCSFKEYYTLPERICFVKYL